VSRETQREVELRAGRTAHVHTVEEVPIHPLGEHHVYPKGPGDGWLPEDGGARTGPLVPVDRVEAERAAGAAVHIRRDERSVGRGAQRLTLGARALFERGAAERQNTTPKGPIFEETQVSPIEEVSSGYVVWRIGRLCIAIAGQMGSSRSLLCSVKMINWSIFRFITSTIGAT